jgi:hypothetical protein
VITRDQRLYPGSDLLHDSGTLVTTDKRNGHRNVACHRMVVGVTKARGLYSDQELARLRRINDDPLDRPRVPHLP